MSAILEHGLYRFPLLTTSSPTAFLVELTPHEVWHSQCSYPNIHTIQLIVKENIFSLPDTTSSSPCQSSLMGNLAKIPLALVEHYVATTTTTTTLDFIIHMDFHSQK